MKFPLDMFDVGGNITISDVLNTVADWLFPESTDVLNSYKKLIDKD
jgi:hypothetical protein